MNTGLKRIVVTMVIVNDEPSLIPYYELINQTGMDIQLIAGEWLFKLESYYRTGQGDNFFATNCLSQ